MQFIKDDVKLLLQEMRAEDFAAKQIAKAADKYAHTAESAIIDIDCLDPIACPPDRRIRLDDKEAWIYDHGKVCELVFVRLN